MEIVTGSSRWALLENIDYRTSQSAWMAHGRLPNRGETVYHWHHNGDKGIVTPFTVDRVEAYGRNGKAGISVFLGDREYSINDLFPSEEQARRPHAKPKTLGDVTCEAWKGGDPQEFGKVYDRLRFKYGGTFQTQADIHAFLCNVLRKRGTPEGELPSLADMDARVYAYEHHIE